MAGDRPKVAAIGEVMVELSPARVGEGSGDGYNLAFAGDTFNTAVSLARLGVSVAYVTRLGDDPFSDKILALMVEEGVDGRLVERVPGRQPGLYIIANSADGERQFRYWRAESPARELWGCDQVARQLDTALAEYPYLYLSGITLAIMGVEARARLKTCLVNHRSRGGVVVFDSNYRAGLWRSLEEARETLEDFLAVSDMALLTLEDEQALWGELSAAELAEHHRQRGVTELVIKRGGAPVLLCHGAGIVEVPVPPVADIVDTTGAGDAFNAGYLTARLRGEGASEAAAAGNRAASAVIRRSGGIVDRAWFVREAGGRATASLCARFEWSHSFFTRLP